ncbi:unnamed protein product [Linum trigynum]|uniref:HMA domain-containing protein n=1 Tax=Linum trigynum TaxID=586398 RepID=A0AAV2CEU8_9ROSI
MHCQGCATKVYDCLFEFGGVEDVLIEIENDIVVAKGNNLDPLKLLDRLQKKYSKNVELISPIPKPQPPIQEKKETPKPQEPKLKTLILKVLMHCEGCARDIEKIVGRMQGVASVQADMNSATVVVIGFFDPPTLIKKVRRQLGNKHVEVLKQQKDVECKGKSKDQPPRREKEEQQPAYVCFCTPPEPFRPLSVHPCQVFSDENVFACTIM